jgi:hypothetical protein
MDLRHPGRGHGIVVDVVEHLVRHELLRQHLPDLARRYRPSTLLQDLQLGGDLGRQQVGPGRQELPELDEDAAGPFEHGPDTRTSRSAADLLAGGLHDERARRRAHEIELSWGGSGVIPR